MAQTGIETLPQWLQDALALLGRNVYLRVLVLVLVTVVAAKLLGLLVSGVLEAWTRRSKTDLDDRFVAILHRPVFLSVLLIGFWLISLELELGDPYARLVLRIIKTLAILIWLGFGLGLASLLVEAAGRLENRFQIVSPRTTPLFDILLRGLVVGGAVYFFFLSWGIDVAAWMMGAGVVGIAVGFAAKDTLANLFSGLFILADAPYKLGDFIVLDTGDRGEVTQIGLRSTRLLTRDDLEVTIPNAVIANAKITNEAGGPSEKRRVRVKVGVAYDSDLDRVRAVLQEIAEAEELVSAEPEPRVRMRGFGDSSLDLELLCWIDRPVLSGQALDNLYMAIYHRFRDEGIVIPFPQRDVWMRRSTDE